MGIKKFLIMTVSMAALLFPSFSTAAAHQQPQGMHSIHIPDPHIHLSPAPHPIHTTQPSSFPKIQPSPMHTIVHSVKNAPFFPNPSPSSAVQKNLARQHMNTTPVQPTPIQPLKPIPSVVLTGAMTTNFLKNLLAEQQSMKSSMDKQIANTVPAMKKPTIVSHFVREDDLHTFFSNFRFSPSVPVSYHVEQSYYVEQPSHYAKVYPEPPFYMEKPTYTKTHTTDDFTKPGTLRYLKDFSEQKNQNNVLQNLSKKITPFSNPPSSLKNRTQNLEGNKK